MTDQISVLLSEERRFPPPAEFAARANATPAIYEAAARDRLAFWAEQARALDWIPPWQSVLEWTPPHARWFVGGELNVSANCLDRHLTGPAPQQGRDHLGRRAGRPPGAHLLGARPGKSAARPTRSGVSASARATGSRSTCR